MANIKSVRIGLNVTNERSSKMEEALNILLWYMRLRLFVIVIGLTFVIVPVLLLIGASVWDWIDNYKNKKKKK